MFHVLSLDASFHSTYNSGLLIIMSLSAISPRTPHALLLRSSSVTVVFFVVKASAMPRTCGTTNQPSIISHPQTDQSINCAKEGTKERRKEGTTYALSVDTTLAQLQRAQRCVVEQRLSERNRALVRDVVVVQNQRLERVAVVLGGRLVLQADRQAGDRW